MNHRLNRPIHWLAMTAACLTSGLAYAQPSANYELLLSPFSLDKLAEAPPAASTADQENKPSFICLRTGGTTSLGQDGLLGGLPSAEQCLGQRAIGGVKTRFRVTQILAAPAGGCGAAAWSSVSFQEEKRESVAEQRLKELVKVVTGNFAAKGTATAAVASARNWCVRTEVFATSLSRSTLTVTAKTAGDKPEEVAATTILTGSPEHLFITGDALFKGAKELKWDAATKTLSAKDKPNQLYVGINWMKGDVLSRTDAAAVDRMVFKLSFLPTRKPFDSVGVGVGYRLSDSVFTTDASQGKDGGVMVFAGHFWTKSDALDAAGQPINGGKREKSWRLGLSYSFDTLLGTLKK
jgi:hypothetical protein